MLIENTEVLTEYGFVDLERFALYNKDLDVNSTKIAQFNIKPRTIEFVPFKLSEEYYSGDVYYLGKVGLTPKTLILSAVFNRISTQSIESFDKKAHFFNIGLKNTGRDYVSWEERLLVAFYLFGYRVKGLKLNLVKRLRFKYLRSAQERRLKWICDNGGFFYHDKEVHYHGKLPLKLEWLNYNNYSGKWYKEIFNDCRTWLPRLGSNDFVQTISVFKDYRPKSGQFKTKKELKYYEGKVYSVKVPSKAFPVRRNGKIIICGI